MTRKMTRREAIAGLAAVPAAALTPGDAFAERDPLLEAIAAYEAGKAAFEAILFTGAESLEEEDEAIASTYGAPFDRLIEWQEPATSRAGAIAALRLAQEESEFITASDLVLPMVAAALGYLEARWPS